MAMASSILRMTTSCLPLGLMKMATVGATAIVTTMATTTATATKTAGAKGTRTVTVGTTEIETAMVGTTTMRIGTVGTMATATTMAGTMATRTAMAGTMATKIVTESLMSFVNDTMIFVTVFSLLLTPHPLTRPTPLGTMTFVKRFQDTPIAGMVAVMTFVPDTPTTPTVWVVEMTTASGSPKKLGVMVMTCRGFATLTPNTPSATKVADPGEMISVWTTLDIPTVEDQVFVM